MRVDKGGMVYTVSADQYGRLWVSNSENLTNPFVLGVGEEPAMGDSNVLLDVGCHPYLLWLGRGIVPHRAVLYYFTVCSGYWLPSSISGC